MKKFIDENGNTVRAMTLGDLSDEEFAAKLEVLEKDLGDALDAKRQASRAGVRLATSRLPYKDDEAEGGAE